MLSLPAHLLKFLDAALRREWLVTNGLGGYASGTVSGVNTRRYHGLLVASFAPPVRRTVLVAKVDEVVTVHDGRDWPVELGANEYADGTIAPEGYRSLTGFRLEGTIPVWTFAVSGAVLEKSIWMPHGRNTSCVRYRVLPGGLPLRLAIRPYLTERDHHALTQGDPRWRFDVAPIPDGIRVIPWPGAAPYTLTVDRGGFADAPAWHWRFLHRVERDRGLDHIEDLYVPGAFETSLEPGEHVTLRVSAEPDAAGETGTYEHERLRHQVLLDRAGALPRDPEALPGPGGLRDALVLAADAFLVQGGGRHSVIAGYHWFEDWGRDAMISLPGLTLATGRLDDAREILRSFTGVVSEGMLPNRFPDDGAPRSTRAPTRRCGTRTRSTGTSRACGTASSSNRRTPRSGRSRSGTRPARATASGSTRPTACSRPANPAWR